MGFCPGAARSEVCRAGREEQVGQLDLAFSFDPEDPDHLEFLTAL